MSHGVQQEPATWRHYKYLPGPQRAGGTPLGSIKNAYRRLAKKLEEEEIYNYKARWVHGR